MFAPIELPSSAVASRVASTKLVFSAPAAVRIARFNRSVGSENAADSDDAGAADAGDDDRVGLTDRRLHSFRQRRPILRRFDAPAALELRALDANEGRTEALQAGKVLVAARLVDGALAPPLGFQRLHRDAVRLHAAVA